MRLDDPRGYDLVSAGDTVGSAAVDRAYMINVASSERAVGHGAWTRISGFSENVLTWIQQKENG